MWMRALAGVALAGLSVCEGCGEPERIASPAIAIAPDEEASAGWSREAEPTAAEAQAAAAASGEGPAGRELAAVAVPGAAGRPPLNLAPWQPGLPLAEPPHGQVRLAIDDGPVVVVDGEQLVVFHGDGTTAARVAPMPPGAFAMSPRSVEPHYDGFADGTFLLEARRDSLVAVAATTLRERWRMEVDPVNAGAIQSTGEVFVMGGRTITAVSASDGEVRWRRQLSEPPEGTTGWMWWKRVTARGVVAIAEPRGGVVGVDANTGAERWRGPTTAPAPHLVGPDEDRIALIDGRDVTVLDIDDGARLGALRLPHSPSFRGDAVVLHGDWVFSAWLPDPRTLRVHGVRWRGGDDAWSRDLVNPDNAEPSWRDSWWNAGPSLAVDDGALLVCHESHVSRVLAPETGRTILTERATRCELPRTWRPRPDAPRVFFTDPWGAVTALARSDTPRSSRRLTARGAVRCLGELAAGVEIWVGERQLHADARGRFQTTLQTDGPVRVTVLPHPLRPGHTCSAHGQVTDGSGPLAFDIQSTLGDEPIPALEGL